MQGDLDRDEETLIHIHHESQQDMESCNITANQGPKHTKTIANGQRNGERSEVGGCPNSWGGGTRGVTGETLT